MFTAYGKGVCGVSATVWYRGEEVTPRNGSHGLENPATKARLFFNEKVGNIYV
jgi:hypothetical protein